MTIRPQALRKDYIKGPFSLSNPSRATSIHKFHTQPVTSLPKMLALKRRKGRKSKKWKICTEDKIIITIFLPIFVCFHLLIRQTSRTMNNFRPNKIVKKKRKPIPKNTIKM